ncbi:MAG: protein kinase [Acidobacteriaceae bacterium]
MQCAVCGDINEDSRESCASCGSGLHPGIGTPAAVGAATQRARQISKPEVFPDLGSRYRVESKLGQGGMGAVYKALDLDLERYVAVKLMRSELLDQPDALQRFKQELLLASRISHKNILRIHDLGDSNGVKFFTMAYVDGEDLKSLIHREAPLSIRRTTEIALQLCSALEAAHGEQVVHRDLKPENVLIDRASGQVCVSDFGLSKSIEVEDVTRMTMAGHSMGTPRYMSPEQVQCKNIDQRSDLYAMGLILNEMLTGDSPFAGGSVFDQMLQRVQSAPRNPRELRPDLPDYMVNIVMRCLERDPELRYQSAADIATDLRNQSSSQVALPPAAASGSIAAALATPAQPAPQAAVAVPAANRHRLKIAAIAAVAILLLAAGLYRIVYLETHRAASPTSAASSSRSAPAHVSRIAVLPFQVLGDDPKLKFMAAGFEDSLASNLSQLQSVNLAASTAADKLGANTPVDVAAKKLGAQYVINGTLQGSSDRIRLVANITDTSGKSPPWSYTLDGVPKDILTLEDQLFNKVTSALRLTETPDEISRTLVRSTEDLSAYDLYLKGHDSLRGSESVKNIQDAVKDFEGSVKADPRFARGYAGLASASLGMYLRTKDSSWAQRALGAAEQARRLDENLPEARFSAAYVYSKTGRTAEAVSELQSALKLAPSSDEGYRRLGEAFAEAGNKKDAIASAQHAVELNPYYWINYYILGQLYMRYGEYSNALAQFRKVTELEPSNAEGYQNIGNSLFLAGNISESLEAYKKALELEPTNENYGNIATAYLFLKRYPEAIAAYKKAIELNPREQVTAGNLGDAYRFSGDQKQANLMYQKAIALATQDLKVNPRNASTISAIALYYAKMGDAQRAIPLSDKARQLDPNDAGLMSENAIVNALAGKTDAAIRSLEQAFAHGYTAKSAENEPELKALRSDPRYQQLIAKYKK